MVDGWHRARSSTWKAEHALDDPARDMNPLVADDISRAARGAYDLVATQGASTAMKAGYDLAVARYVLQQSAASPRWPTGWHGGPGAAVKGFAVANEVEELDRLSRERIRLLGVFTV